MTTPAKKDGKQFVIMRPGCGKYEVGDTVVLTTGEAEFYKAKIQPVPEKQTKKLATGAKPKA